MRSEVKFQVDTGPRGPRGGTCSPSQESTPEPEAPGWCVCVEGGWRRGAPAAPEPLAVGRAAQNGNWKVLRINIQVEELGRRPWVLREPPF